MGLTRRAFISGAIALTSGAYIGHKRYDPFKVQPQDIAFSDFMKRAQNNDFKTIILEGNVITAQDVAEKDFRTISPLDQQALYTALTKTNAAIWVKDPQTTTIAHFGKAVRREGAEWSFVASSVVLAHSLWRIRQNKKETQFMRANLDQDNEKQTAYHEAGHAVIGLLHPGINIIHHANINPEAGFFGYVHFRNPSKIKSASRQTLKNELMIMLAGRAAEEEFFGDNAFTIGTENDIERAKEIASNMVKRFGMSEKIGPIPYDENPSLFKRVFFGASRMSDAKAQEVEEEIEKLVRGALDDTKKSISENKEKVENLAQKLLEKKILNEEEIRAATSIDYQSHTAPSAEAQN